MPLQKARLRISDYSADRRSRTAQREKRIRLISLSLTSMVDMFAILVIFLLANSGSVSQWLELDASVQLPKAKHAVEVKEGPTVQLTAKSLVAGKETLLTLEELNASPVPIAKLKQWLSQQKDTKEINLVGHEALPYGSVRKIVQTAKLAGVENVSLAVEPLP